MMWIGGPLGCRKSFLNVECVENLPSISYDDSYTREKLGADPPHSKEIRWLSRDYIVLCARAD